MAYDFSAEQVVSAIEGTGGIISSVAKRLGCSWATAEKFIKKFDESKEAYNNEKEKLLDLAENTMIAAMQEGNLDAAKYYLGKKGQERGYQDTQKVDHVHKIYNLTEEEEAEIKHELGIVKSLGLPKQISS